MRTKPPDWKGEACALGPRLSTDVWLQLFWANGMNEQVRALIAYASDLGRQVEIVRNQQLELVKAMDELKTALKVSVSTTLDHREELDRLHNTVAVLVKNSIT